MAKETVPLFGFNRGLISKYGLARTDVKRVALSASVMTNWIPRILGSMMLRPGLGYIGGVLNNAVSVHIPFIFSTTDTALLEMTDSVMRVRVDDELVSRVAVSTAITNGTFSALGSWSDLDETGAVSDNTGSKLNLTGTGYNAAIREQQVTVAGGDQNVQHALRIVVERGPVTLRVGSSSGADDYITETALKTGTHSLAFTPTGDFYVRLLSTARAVKYVTSVAVESSGVLQLPTPWTVNYLSLMRWDQSGDVVFVACSGFQQRRIERRNNNSWSVVLYEPEDGPFRVVNTGPVTITPSAANGDITLTASRAIFKSTHVGALFRLISEGQSVSQLLAGADQYSDTVRVNGVGTTSRSVVISRSGTYTGTLSLQRSFDAGGSWSTVQTYTGTGSSTWDDSQAAQGGLANVIALYRIGFIGSDYTSGSVTVTLTNPGGGITGVARVTAYSSGTSVSAAVIKSLGGTTATNLWYEGDWSDYRGWPTAVAIHEGRLWFAGRTKAWGSESDGYENFDDTVEGDAGPINRSIGRGPVDTINWLLPLLRLVVGAQGSEITVRTSALDEPITPSNFNLKYSSTQGSSAAPAVPVDTEGFFVQKSGQALHKLTLEPNSASYVAENVSQYVYPDLLSPGIVRLAVQRKPETRIHCVLDDGTVAVLLFDVLENVTSWQLFETDGEVEDAFVLPGDIEDQVYYTVKRTVNSSTVRYLEKWAREDECVGVALNKQADSFVTYSGSSSTISGLDHLEGEEVIVWADSADFSPDDSDGVQRTYTVASGSITLDSAVSNAVVGLPYTAQWKSTKLAYAAQMGTALTQKKAISQVGLVVADTHTYGLKVGQDFDHLDDLPLVRDNGATIGANDVGDDDVESFPINGSWDTDSRLCLQAKAPRPANVLAAVIGISTSDKA